MADETANRLLVRIEASQAKFEKQMAAVAKSASKGANDIERSFKKANDNAVVSVGATRAAVSNLSFQLNDIAQGLASGTSPFTIMVQQGSQVAQALQGAGGGLIGAVKTLGGAFTQMLNPVSLASFALIGLGGALVQYVFSGKDEVESLDASLKEHAEFIRSIKDSYGEAVEGLENYAKESATVFQLMAQGRLSSELATLRDEATKLRDSISGTVNVDDFGGARAFRATEAYKVLQQEITNLTQSIANGEPDIRGFRERITELAATDPTNKALQTLAQALLAASNEGLKADQALRQTKIVIDGLGDIASGQAAGVDKLSASLKTLAGIALPNLSELEKATQAYTEGLKNAKTVEERIGLGKAFGDAQRRIAASNMPTPAQKPNLESIEPEKPTKPKKAAEDRTREKEAREAERESESVQRLIENLQFERSIMGLTGVEREKAIALRRAEKGATEEQKMQIAALIESNYAEKQALAETARAMEELRDLGREALGGFISDLLDGKSAADALADSLKRIGDRLLNSGLDGLFGTGGGGGGGFGLLGSLFGGGSSGGGSSDPWSGLRLPGFASGTNNAPGGLALVGERGPEIVNLPKGSQVIPNAPSMKALSGRGGSGSFTFAPVIDARGASVDAVARLEQVVAKQQQEFSARVVDTVRRAQKTRNL
ncbi:phage tail length tape measure family protein [Phyllobacterium pellucidum]|uniref:phage tail length tape measure family protein n=1 Tax=Phyllobacterium pellucidum TaxID=2740464 RepID=UPI00158CE645|nr:phage tail length tape measure family protein [Phyllobacterium pellucidum]